MFLTWQLHCLPADYARELFKSSKDAMSLLVWILKELERFGFHFLWVT